MTWNSGRAARSVAEPVHDARADNNRTQREQFSAAGAAFLNMPVTIGCSSGAIDGPPCWHEQYDLRMMAIDAGSMATMMVKASGMSTPPENPCRACNKIISPRLRA